MGIYLSYPEITVHDVQATNKNVNASFCGIQGYRHENEDGHLLATNIKDLPGCSIFGIFDGHAGIATSKYASENFLEILTQQTDFVASVQVLLKSSHDKFMKNDHVVVDDKKNSSSKDHLIITDSSSNFTTAQEHNIKSQIIRAFQIIDKNCLASLQGSVEQSSGSTATCVIIFEKYLIFINLGDSRSILINDHGQLLFETKDHKPTNIDERKRIFNAGGTVEKDRINSTLAVSRAFGDFNYKNNKDYDAENQMVSPIPDIIFIKRDPLKHKYVVLACDGIWDVISSEQMSNFVENHMRATNSNLKLTVERAVFGALSKGSLDNICMILVSIQSQKTSNDSKKSDKQLIESAKSEKCSLDAFISELKSKSDLIIQQKDFSQETNPLHNLSHLITKQVIANYIKIDLFPIIEQPILDYQINISTNSNNNGVPLKANMESGAYSSSLSSNMLNNDSHWFYKDLYEHVLNSLTIIFTRDNDVRSQNSIGESSKKSVISSHESGKKNGANNSLED